MLVTTTETIAGKVVAESLGVAVGNVIRAKHLGKDIAVAFRAMIGGEIKEYTELLFESRQQAIKRMVDEATQMGADAVVSMRLTTSQVISGAAEIVAYGTAVKLADR